MKYKILLFSLILTGCQKGTNPLDPYEESNRQVFEFNQKADRYVFVPVIDFYESVLPTPLRLVIHNFYSNLTEISYTINDGLQGEWLNCYHGSLRLLVNSTFGIAGIFDMASDLGLDRKQNDFGRTLYIYGYKESDYYILPVFGPSTVRDMWGVSVDRILFSPLTYIHPAMTRNALFLGDLIETKASVSDYLENFPQPAYIDDEYSFIRDAWMQWRRNQLARVVDWDSFYDAH